VLVLLLRGLVVRGAACVLLFWVGFGVFCIVSFRGMVCGVVSVV